MSDSGVTASLRDTERSAVDAADNQLYKQMVNYLTRYNYYTTKSDTQRNHQLIGKITNHFT